MKLHTLSGILLDYVKPTPEMITLSDVATGLSREYRFGNQGPRFRVAQHSVLCAYVANKLQERFPDKFKYPEGFVMEALLHDATEAYMHDIPSPLKRLLPAYSEVEDRLWSQALAPKFGLNPRLSNATHFVDRLVFVWEVNSLIDSEEQKQEWLANYSEYLPMYEALIDHSIESLWEEEQAELYFRFTYAALADATKETPLVDVTCTRDQQKEVVQALLMRTGFSGLLKAEERLVDALLNPSLRLLTLGKTCPPGIPSAGYQAFKQAAALWPTLMAVSYPYEEAILLQAPTEPELGFEGLQGFDYDTLFAEDV